VIRFTGYGVIAAILQYFSAESDGATADRKIRNHKFSSLL